MLRVIVIGLGPIGHNTAKAVLADSGMKLVGLVDIDPKLIGKVPDGLEGAPKVVASIDEAVKGGCDVAIVTTTSKFDRAADTFRTLIAKKIHISSSCEEMAWPYFLYPDLAKQIDAEASKAGIAMIGTGVNPGFVMDFLPVVLSSMVAKVTGVKVVRQLDASKRRQPLQAKVGATMTVEHFNGLAREGKIGHMGIGESVAMIAHGLGRTAHKKDVKITLEPVVAETELPSLLGTIKPGQVRGMRNTAKWSGDWLSIELDLTMAVGTKDPHDRVELTGPVPLNLRIEGGTPGDTATVAALVNCARQCPKAKPGLRTMLDFPVAGAQGK